MIVAGTGDTDPEMLQRISPEARSKAVMEVQLRLEGGEAPDSAIAFLEGRGLPSADARELVDNFVRATIADNRRRGATRLVIGAVCLLLSVPVVVSALTADTHGVGRVRGFGSAVSAVGLVAAVGGWLVLRGLQLFFAGHRSMGD